MVRLRIEACCGYLNFILPSHLAGPLRHEGVPEGLFVVRYVHYRTPARPLGGKRPGTMMPHLIFHKQIIGFGY
jgi:hypothetical protein